MRRLFILSVFIFNSISSFSQKDLNYFYSDTIWEMDHMRCELRGAMAYNDDAFKAQLIFTNFSDSFKVITPSNIQIKLPGGEAYPLKHNGLFVIPPKGTERIRLKFIATNFKSKQLELNISDIQTSGSPLSFYNFGTTELNEDLKKALKEKMFNHRVVGPIDMYIKTFSYKSNGNLVVKMIVKYNNPNFLGFFLKNLKAKDLKGNLYVNTKIAVHHYRTEKREVVVTAVFDTRDPSAEKIMKDAIIIDNVFAEYLLTTNKNIHRFILNKSGEGKGNPKNNDEKTEDIEVIED